jgi:hypothetical protein
MLSLFYEEPDPDRFLPFDRYPRRVLRRIVRGPDRPGGQQRVFINLCAGLRRLGQPYRVNDYRYAQRHPDEPVGIVGKPFVLDKLAWKNPIVFGASTFSHPVDDPNLMTRLPVRKMLVPGEWVRQMCAPYYGDAVAVWPVGIDTDLWCPQPEVHKDVDVLVYDKIRWNKTELAATITDVAMSALERRGLNVHIIRYGHYEEDDFHRVLSRARAMLFLCEHETQGIAYQQALSSGVPIYAWDRGGVWADPAYYPDKVSFAPVTSVPYWDDRCGLRFAGIGQFLDEFELFWHAVERGAYHPRAYILEHLTLEQCAQQYIALFNAATSS